MLNRVLLKSLVAAAAVVLSGSAARADFVLDDFSLPTTTVVTSIPLTDANGSGLTTPGVGSLGATRTITYNITSPLASSSLIGQVSSAGRLGVDLGLDTTAQVTIGYNLTPTNFIPNVAGGGAPGAINVTGISQLDFNLEQTPYTLALMTTGGTLTGSGTLTPGGGTTPIALGSLTGTGDLTQVTGVTLTIVAGQAADFAIDALSVTTPAAPPPPPVDVPAPPAFALMLAAVPALGLVRGLRRKVAA